MQKALRIKKDDRLKARSIAATLNTSINRKIALVDMLGLDVTYKYFSKFGIKFNSVNCLHKIPFALEEFRISDLNYNGNVVYVVTVFNENFIRIPRIHFNLNLIPNYYIIAEVNKDLDTGIVGGFIKPKDVLKCPADTNYYYPRISDLSDPEELITILSRKRPSVLPFGKHQDAISLFCKVLDNTISGDEKRRLVAHLLSCPVCLGKLLASCSFDDISNKMILVKNNEKKDGSDIVAEFSKPVSEVSDFDSDFNQKIDILNSTIPSADKGISNLKFLLDYVNNKIDEAPSKVPVITFSLAPLLKYIKKFWLFTIALSVVMKKYLSKLTKKQIGYISLAFFTILLTLNLISFFNSDRILTKEPQIQEIPYDDNYSNTPANQSPLIYAQNAEAYAKSIGIQDVSWDVDKNLAKKPEFVNFLQVLGKNIKLNLQNEFILIDELPNNKNLKLQLNFSNNTTVKNISFIVSSGNQRIDKEILDTLYETLSYVKAPKNGIIMPDLNLVLNISLY